MILANLIHIIIILTPLICAACQQPESYLQLLPKELWCEAMNCILATQPLWRDKDENTRTDQAISVSNLAQELCIFDLQHMIIAKMRTDLLHAKEKILEPFYPQDESALLWNLMFKHTLDQNDESSNHARLCYKDPSCPDNPKNFQKLLPLKSVLSYYAIDQEWVKNFLLSKNCGGTFRKHVFINALLYRHENLVHYLWISRYRTKTLMFQLRNRPFICLASSTAQSSGYTEIHYEFEQLHEKIKARIKAAQVYYPG